jgi:hypothetical protein
MDYLVRVAHRKGGDSLLRFDEDLTDIDAASRLVPGDISKGVAELKQGLTRVRRLVDEMGAESDFSRSLDAALAKTTPQVEAIVQLDCEAVATIRETVTYLGEREGCTAQHMFSVLGEFTRGFAAARTKLKMRIKREERQQQQMQAEEAKMVNQ